MILTDDVTQYNPYFFPVPEGGQMKPWDLSITLITIFFILTIFPLCFYFGRKARTNDKIRDFFPFGIGLFLIITEIYKQLLVTYHYNWEYHYYIFPFQLCAIPMYVSTLVLFVKNKNVKDSLFSFMSLYGMTGGVAVMLYQQSVLTYEDYSLDIHSIVWHLLLIALGIFSATYLDFGSKTFMRNFKIYLKGSTVFMVVVVIAELLNLLIVLNHGYNEYTAGGNLFYISMWMFNLDIPVLKNITSNYGWYVALLGYVVALLLCGLFITYIYYLIQKISGLDHKKSKENLEISK